MAVDITSFFTLEMRLCILCPLVVSCTFLLMYCSRSSRKFMKTENLHAEQRIHTACLSHVSHLSLSVASPSLSAACLVFSTPFFCFSHPALPLFINMSLSLFRVYAVFFLFSLL